MPTYNVKHNGKYSAFTTISDGFLKEFTDLKEHLDWWKWHYNIDEQMTENSFMSVEECIRSIICSHFYGESSELEETIKDLKEVGLYDEYIDYARKYRERVEEDHRKDEEEYQRRKNDTR